ncbi:MAG: 2'-5' RNA ligase family protein [Bacteroidetes bacterium]|nr:2'-5' RNA ligase family protein [Bacteroidota bacterium]
MIGYAIELLFDTKSENKIFELVETLKKHKIKNKFLEVKSKPHIALSVFDKIDENEVINLIKNIEIKKMKISMNGIGTFHGKENTIYLIPKATTELLNFQKSLHKQLLSYSNCWDYYYPENWIPHCTVAMNVADDKFLNAFKLIRENFSPINATIKKINLIKFHPVEILYEKEISI